MSEQNTRYIDRPGRFSCKIKEPGNGWFGESKEKGTPFIRIPCRAIEGEQSGREIVWNGWLSDAAFDRTIETLVKVCPAWDGDLAALENGTFTFAGCECEIVAESETYDGKTMIKARWLNPVGGGGGKKLDTDKVSSLIARLGRKSKAIAKTFAARSPVMEKSGQEVDEDDIPY